MKFIKGHDRCNTPNTESIATVMIPQGAWRRLFNQLHEDESVSKAIEFVFNASTDDERINSINNLYEVNEGNKNNLTGRSGNAINCFLAAHDPFKNLSIVSQNDREKLITTLGFNYSNDSKSIGAQIIETSKLIKDKFIESNILNNARTITSFVYSKPFVNFWKKKIDRTVIETSEVVNYEDERIIHYDFIFYMEKQLEDFLIENWDKTELGEKFDLIMDEEGLVSQQYKNRYWDD